MKYMGSKRRIALPITRIIRGIRQDGQCYVEPFVGGGNIIERLDGYRIASDINPRVIRALEDIRDNTDHLPKNNKEFTEEDYRRLRTSDAYRYKDYAGYAFSYGGKWLGGWRRDSKGRDYVKEAYNSAVRQSALLKGVLFFCCSYDSLQIPEKSLIYCDPPYKGTTSYGVSFDHDKFFSWCKEMSGKGHTVLISEYEAPEGFTCIWTGEIINEFTKGSKRRLGREKLFIA